MKSNATENLSQMILLLEQKKGCQFASLHQHYIVISESVNL
jgi:hypothetical protein